MAQKLQTTIPTALRYLADKAERLDALAAGVKAGRLHPDFSVPTGRQLVAGLDRLTIPQGGEFLADYRDSLRTRALVFAEPSTETAVGF